MHAPVRYEITISQQALRFRRKQTDAHAIALILLDTVEVSQIVVGGKSFQIGSQEAKLKITQESLVESEIVIQVSGEMMDGFEAHSVEHE